MKYLILVGKLFGYSVLVLLFVIQTIAFASSSNLREVLIRGGMMLVIGGFLAIKLQRKLRKPDSSTN